MKPIDVALAVSVTAMWGMGFVLAKGAIEQMPPILLMALRFSVSALALTWFVTPPRHLLQRIFVIALIGSAIQYSLTFTGVKYLDASVAIIVVQLEVPFAALLAAIVFKDRLGARRGVGMVLAFCGIALIAGEPRLHGQLIPLVLVIGGAFSWAIAQILIKRLGPVGGFALNAWMAIFAVPQLLLCSVLFESGQVEAIASADWSVWAAVVYLGLIMTALGYGIWYRLIARYDINQVMPFLLLLPGFTVVGSILLLGETVTPAVVTGGLIAVGGVGMIMIERNPFGRSGRRGPGAAGSGRAARR